MHEIGFHPALIALAAASMPAVAAAQAAPDVLMGLDKNSLRGEIVRRYDEALALGKSLVAADDPRFLWASQAKAQCGIAFGFLKSGTREPVSIGKCDDAYRRMQLRPVAAVADRNGEYMSAEPAGTAVSGSR